MTEPDDQKPNTAWHPNLAGMRNRLLDWSADLKKVPEDPESNPLYLANLLYLGRAIEGLAVGLSDVA